MTTYAIKTTFAMSAARPPAHVGLPRHISIVVTERVEIRNELTLEDETDTKEVCANWQSDHGKGEAHQLPDDGAVVM
jgi:hypothetical protein